MELKINNKVITIYSTETSNEVLPVVVLNTFNNEGKSVWEKCNFLKVNDFILVTVSNLNWNNDLTPWKVSPLFKGDEEYLGYADKYLEELENQILKETEEYIKNKLNKKISYYIIAGYSLGGLFAVYSSFKTNRFKRIASASGSFWYLNFLEYVKSNKISSNIDKIYFSLGNKEKNTKIEVLSTVEDKTKEIYKYLKESINCIYEENEGNHFKDADLRMAKAIKSILE